MRFEAVRFFQVRQANAPSHLTQIFRLRGLSEEVHNRFGLPHNGNEGRKEVRRKGKRERLTYRLSRLAGCLERDGFGIAKRQLPATVQLPKETDFVCGLQVELKTTCNGPYKFSKGALYR